MSLRQRALALAMASVALVATAGGCEDINGGAVELSWSFQTFQGGFIDDDCSDTNVGEVRLSWMSAPWSESMSSGITAFPCEAFRGITDFIIVEGPQLLSIAPVCVGDVVPAAARSYEVPAPILREVRTGEVVTLDSLLIVIDDVSIPDCACCDDAADGPGDRGMAAGSIRDLDRDHFASRENQGTTTGSPPSRHLPGTSLYHDRYITLPTGRSASGTEDI